MEPTYADSGAVATGLNRKGKIICGLDPSTVDSVMKALETVQVHNEQIEVIQAADAERLHHPPQDCGFSCQINRVFLSMGDELDEFEWEREELERGHVLVCVPAGNDDEQSRVRDILREHGGRSIHYYGRWTIKALD